jgi:hypothetical protein
LETLARDQFAGELFPTEFHHFPHGNSAAQNNPKQTGTLRHRFLDPTRASRQLAALLLRS